MAKKLYRGVSEETCNKYKKEGIPKNQRFTTDIKIARSHGKCIIVKNKDKDFEMDIIGTDPFKRLNIDEEYYKNKKIIKKFKIKN